MKDQPDSPIAIVRPAKKLLPYSITPINDLQAYREDMANRETAYQANKSILEAARRSIAIQMVVGQESTVTFTPEEREEIQTLIKKRQLADTEAKLERAQYEQDLSFFYELPIATIKKSLLQKCKDVAARVWRDAFDSNK